MKSIDRGNFCKHNAYMDSPQGIGYHVTISAPHMVSFTTLSKDNFAGVPAMMFYIKHIILNVQQINIQCCSAVV